MVSKYMNKKWPRLNWSLKIIELCTTGIVLSAQGIFKAGCHFYLFIFLADSNSTLSSLPLLPISTAYSKLSMDSSIACYNLYFPNCNSLLVFLNKHIFSIILNLPQFTSLFWLTLLKKLQKHLQVLNYCYASMFIHPSNWILSCCLLSWPLANSLWLNKFLLLSLLFTL